MSRLGCHDLPAILHILKRKPINNCHNYSMFRDVPEFSMFLVLSTTTRKDDGDMRQIKFKFRNQIRALKLYYSLCSVESFPTADAVVDKSRNMEHPGTFRNIPEHPGTSNNYDNYEKRLKRPAIWKRQG